MVPIIFVDSTCRWVSVCNSYKFVGIILNIESRNSLILLFFMKDKLVKWNFLVSLFALRGGVNFIDLCIA